jgi:anti-sigma regulatory factor (Ser/Thr protein kinase)
VATEPKTLHLVLDADLRLAAAAGGVARYLADVAGLDSDAIARLQAAVIAACTEAFEHLTAAHPHLEITFTRLSDRMEVALSHQGEGSPPVGLDRIAGFAARIGGTKSSPGVFAGFDRVQYETHDGEAVTRLTKFLGHIAPGV